jgi:hypothetical protein
MTREDWKWFALVMALSLFWFAIGFMAAMDKA